MLSLLLSTVLILLEVSGDNPESGAVVAGKRRRRRRAGNLNHPFSSFS